MGRQDSPLEHSIGTDLEPLKPGLQQGLVQHPGAEDVLCSLRGSGKGMQFFGAETKQESTIFC